MPFSYHPFLSAALLTLFFAAQPSLAQTQNPTLPKVRVDNVRRVFHNGEHNAFTDLCRFQGHYYLTFRSCPGGHAVNPSASIIVLSSKDAKTWQQVYRFHVPKRDTRDPHFLIFQEKLFVYTGTWYCGDTAPKSYDMNELLGYATWSRNGSDWQDPIMLEGTYGHYVWRAASYGGKAYLCGRRKHHFARVASRKERDPIIESALLESDDGLVWRTAGLFQERYGDETAFLFENEGAILAVARSGGGRNAQVLRSKPPYDQWQRTDLDRYLGGPLIAPWGTRYLVGGRRTAPGVELTSLCWLVGDQLHEFATLPSGGDTSYPGFVQLSPTRALVSYYSSHEKDASGKTITAIYLAELTIEP